MKHFFNPSTHIGSTLQLFKWCGLIIPPAVLAGSASALFLWSLEKVTALRWEYGWLLFFLPLAGFLIGLIYHSLGRSVEGGNNLIMDEIHEPGGGVPIRMAPLVFIGTIVTHLFGGSAGREGTAVQMGGSLASWFGTVFRIEPVNRRVLLMSGIAAGFGSVFGTPLTGAVFAMEVLTIGRMQYDALIPVLIASLVGDYTCSAWGVKHAIYHINFLNAEPTSIWHLNLPLLGKVVVGGALFGLASLFFSELTHALQKIFKRWIPYGPLRPVLGGVLVIAGVYLLGTRDYLGIGVTNPNPGSVSILSAFASDGAHPWSWLWKTLFTAVTLSSGFKGGEVTPLFFIGATLGNTLAWLLNAPVDLFAGLGFIAVFSGATNTPLACTIMGIELFGAQHTVYFATACFLAYFFSGHSGIYPSQRMGVPKRNANEKWLLGKSSTHAIITGMSSLREQFEAVLKTTPEREDALQESLRLILSDFQSETGTIHWLDAEKQLLQLGAQVGLPPQMLDVIKTIPVGKGIAGQTVAQNKPVTICNLQTDTSGVAKPGAKQTGVGGALCVPIRKGDKIIGTLGIGTRRQHEYTAEETQRLEAVANSIAAHL